MGSNPTSRTTYRAEILDISTCIEVLLQDDPESGQEIEEKFCSALASIGDRV